MSLPMHYFSTNRISPTVGFREAVLAGQPDDKGLYFPSEIPRLADGFIERLSETANEQVAYECIRPFVAGDIADDDLFEI